jgi:hypothetical protein
LITKEQDDQNKNYPLILSPIIGNCYLISLLRGLLKFQYQKYYNLFRNCIFDIGYFEVRLYVDNGNNIRTKKKVFVDDFILYSVKENEPYFSRLYDNNNNKYIVSRYLLIEKALAKLKGCFLNIYGNKFGPDEVIATLTGIPPKIFYLNEYNYNFKAFFKIIEDGIKKYNVMICKSKNIPMYNDITIEYCYTIIDINEEDGIFIINLEDPSGKTSTEKSNYMNGNIGDKIKRYNEENIHKGYLKIDMENFINAFESIFICDFYSSNKWFF